MSKFTDILSISDIEESLEKAKELAAEISKKRRQLQTQPEKVIELYEEYSNEAVKAMVYADSLFSTNTDNEDLRQLNTRVSNELTEAAANIQFLTLEIKKFDDEKIAEIAKKLPRIKHWLERIMDYKPHYLSEKEEVVMTYKDMGGADVLVNLYEIMTAAFTYKMEVDGEEKEMTRSELKDYFFDPSREVRKKASDALQVPFEENKDILTTIYQGVVTDWRVETVLLRKYKELMDARHLANNIPAEVYEALMQSAKKNHKIFQDYIKLKQKVLGYKEFTTYDFTAPVKGKPKGTDYESTKKKVLEVFQDFAPWFAEAARKMYENKRVDAHPRKGKRSGAYCYGGSPDQLPVLVVNHTENYENLYTLAHETGHAIHYIQARENSVLTYGAPLVLAEIASIFAEHLVFKDELEKADQQGKIALLCWFMDEAISTIPTQLRYTEFEQEAHQLIAANQAPSELTKLWNELVRRDFPDVVYDKQSVYYLGIPHFFHSPFYCYSYSFGLLIVMAMQAHIKDKDFKQKFRNILAAGGSKKPAELLKDNCFDISKPGFWDAGFQYLKELVDQLEKNLKT